MDMIQQLMTKPAHAYLNCEFLQLVCAPLLLLGLYGLTTTYPQETHNLYLPVENCSNIQDLPSLVASSIAIELTCLHLC